MEERVILKGGNRKPAKKAGGALFIAALLLFFMVYPLKLSSISAPAYISALALAVLGACFFGFALSPLSRDGFMITDKALYVNGARIAASDVEDATQEGRHAVVVRLKQGSKVKLSVGSPSRFLEAVNEAAKAEIRRARRFCPAQAYIPSRR
ncbi:hypothetical protein PQ610_00380 [Tardisphaera miroshnichenkoae]